MKLFSLILISVVCFFLSSCDAITYDVTVETGNQEGAGTNGKVFITVFGDLDTSPTYPLDGPTNPPFIRGQKAILPLTMSFVGKNIYKIRIDLDCTGLTHGNGTNWFLKQVYMAEAYSFAPPKYWFPYDEWLRTSQKKKKVSVEIAAVHVPPPNAAYKVIVETGNQKDAGTHGKVYITLIGSYDDSRKILLDQEGKSEFQRGQTDTFHFKTFYVGVVSKIRIELDSTADSHSPNWFLKEISLVDETQKLYQWFPWNQWLTPTLDERTITVEIPPQLHEPHTGKQ